MTHPIHPILRAFAAPLARMAVAAMHGHGGPISPGDLADRIGVSVHKATGILRYPGMNRLVRVADRLGPCQGPRYALDPAALREAADSLLAMAGRADAAEGRSPGRPGLAITRRPGQRFRVRVGGVDAWVTYDGPDRRFPAEARLVVEAPPEAELTREELVPIPERRRESA